MKLSYTSLSVNTTTSIMLNSAINTNNYIIDLVVLNTNFTQYKPLYPSPKIINKKQVAYNIAAAQSNNFNRAVRLICTNNALSYILRQNKQSLFSTLYFFSSLHSLSSSSTFQK